jgi:phosphoribosylanthranilate isomerase
MILLVKICGLKTPDALDAALDAGADLVGFVLFPLSPRNVGFDAVGALGDRAHGRAAKVALTVDADDALLAQIVETLKPDILQLHGRETPERVGAVKARFGRTVMKALPIAEASDLAAVPAYAGVADRLLFDARPPRDATRPGGLGRPFLICLLVGVIAAGTAAWLNQSRWRRGRRVGCASSARPSEAGLPPGSR